MQFEHVLEVNRPGEAFPPLSREELWFGLLCRAEDARPFLPGLESCRIVARHDHQLTRELVFGTTIIRDHVSLLPPNRISFETEATQEHAGGNLTISIEESDTGELFLRFCYRTDFAEGTESTEEETKIVDVIRSAYHHADLDTLRVIREIARSGTMQ